MMSWNSHYPQSKIIYMTAQVSTFFYDNRATQFAYGTSVSWNAHDTYSSKKQASMFSTKTVVHHFTCGTQFPS